MSVGEISQPVQAQNLLRRSFVFALVVFFVFRFAATLIVGIDRILAPDAIWGFVPPCSAESAQALDSLGPASQLYLAPWERWDTCHYVLIAVSGYAGNTQETVWPPLYPMLIQMVDSIVSPPLLSALIVSNLATILAFWLFYLLVNEIWGCATARRSVLLLAAYPTAFFLIAGYTESLFLALTFGVMLAARHRYWLLAGALAMLATLTRNQGILLAIPILVEAFQAWRDKKILGRLEYPAIGSALVLPVFAFAGFAYYVHHTLGDPWPWQTLEQYWSLVTSWPWQGIFGNLAVFFGSPVPNGFNLGAISADLILTLLAIFWLVQGAKRLPLSFSLIGWATLLIGLMKVPASGVMMSMSRYTLTIFPIFIVQALDLQDRIPFWLWVSLNAVGQVALMIAFTRWVWVA